MNRQEEECGAEETKIVNKFNSVCQNFPNLLLMLLAMILRRELQPLLLYYAINNINSSRNFIICNLRLCVIYIVYYVRNTLISTLTV